MATSSNPDDGNSSSHSWRKWIAAIIFLGFFAVLLWEVVNPYRGQRFEKIPHGDHVHYVPKNRNPEVPVSRFPTRRPDSDQRITPTGEVVPRSRSSQGNPG